MIVLAAIRSNNNFSCIYCDIKNEIAFHVALSEFACTVSHSCYALFNFSSSVTAEMCFGDFLRILFNCFELKTCKNVILRFCVILSKLKSFLSNFKSLMNKKKFKNHYDVMLSSLNVLMIL